MDDLRIEPATAEHLRALIAGPARFTEQFGLTVAAGVVEFEGALEWSLAQVTEAGVALAWLTYLFIIDDRMLAGIGGFKGAPQDGALEIGYAIVPELRGRGLATNAARALVNRARAAGVTLVGAHTLATPDASTAVLTRLGFERVTTRASSSGADSWCWLPICARSANAPRPGCPHPRMATSGPRSRTIRRSAASSSSAV